MSLNNQQSIVVSLASMPQLSSTHITSTVCSIMIVSKVFHYKTLKKGVFAFILGLKVIPGPGYFMLEFNQQENLTFYPSSER